MKTKTIVIWFGVALTGFVIFKHLQSASAPAAVDDSGAAASSGPTIPTAVTVSALSWPVLLLFL